MPTPLNTPTTDWYAAFRSPSFDGLPALDEALYAAAARPSSEAAHAPSWDVGAHVNRGTAAEINASARAEVGRGATALLFRLYRQPGPADLDVILDGLDPTRVNFHCSLRYPGQDPAELFRDLVKALRRRDIPFGDVRGSVDFDPLLDWSEPPFPPLIRLLFFVSRWMPGFRVLQVNAAGFNSGAAAADSELALTLAKGEAYLREVAERGYPAALASRHLQFAFTLGSSPAVDAAKLRAFHLLWPRVCAQLGISDPAGTCVSAYSDVALLRDNAAETTALLRSQACSAALGEVDTLFLAPVATPDAAPTPGTRDRAISLARAAADFQPAPEVDAAIDELARHLADAAWERYHDLAEQGGFVAASSL